MGFYQRSNNISPVPSMDGVWGFHANGADYLAGGWSGSLSPVIQQRVFKSTNLGTTWTELANAPFRFHTAATCVVNNVAYIVGSDQIAPSIYGDWIRSSHKFENEVWTQIAADPGIQNRALSCMVHLNDSFFIIGGQDSNAATTVYDTVLRSDDGLQTFSVIQPDTKTQGFTNPLSWDSCCVHQNLIWSVCGSQHADQRGKFIFSSPDGINWTYRAMFRGLSRSYANVISHNGRLYLFNGHNPRWNLAGNPTGNLIDFWVIDVLNGGRIVQTRLGDTPWTRRHALSVWSNPQGIMAGLGVLPDMWMYET